ncbi:hypothetical protein AB1Y20_006873 [Prymnesium parvum]|uniref:PDZ domain-containing protein n=1 Tax=Prymnesium parvum TaxID=97485 RepID=A0AB34IZJ2_PRYPA
MATSLAVQAVLAFQAVHSCLPRLPLHPVHRCPPSRTTAAAMASRELGALQQLEIDLGPSGEPAGKVQLKLAPLLQDSEFLQLELRLPLGMVIDVREDGGGSVAGRWYQKTRVVVTDALPGYSSYGAVKQGDLLRAITAYRTVLINEGGYSAWKQLTSYTPVGEPMLKRLIFRCEGASYNDIKDAIQSHREGNNIATLVIERARSPRARDDGEEETV